MNSDDKKTLHSIFSLETNHFYKMKSFETLVIQKDLEKVCRLIRPA